MNLDDAIEKLQLDIAEVINKSGVPLSIVDLILERISNEVKTTMVRTRRESVEKVEVPDEPKPKSKSKS